MANQWREISAKNKKRMLGAVKKTIKSMGKDIIKRSPVDTGRFKGNWNAAIDAPNTAIDLASGAGLTEMANQIKIGDTFFFTNSLHYALALEFGHSQQAPMGMVRLAVAQFPFTVDRISAEFIANPTLKE